MKMNKRQVGNCYLIGTENTTGYILHIVFLQNISGKILKIYF